MSRSRGSQKNGGSRGQPAGRGQGRGSSQNGRFTDPRQQFFEATSQADDCELPSSRRCAKMKH